MDSEKFIYSCEMQLNHYGGIQAKQIGGDNSEGETLMCQGHPVGGGVLLNR